MSVKEVLDVIPTMAVLIALVVSVAFFGIPRITRKRGLQ